ncbi:MAG: hypothetical protein JXA30_06565 [Deltaproteobacteria bacterium]|nr:hypothetical protein [Deltaproteobacteria bacterium]
MTNWIEEAESALDGNPSQMAEVLPNFRPPLFDLQGVQAITSPVLAIFFWAVEILRENLSDHPLDPLALLLRLIALAFTLRAVLMGKMLWSRFRAWSAYRRYGLALTDYGLVLRTPACDLVVDRNDIVGIREQGYVFRPRGRRWRDVYVITRPQSGRHYLAIPPFFESTSTLLAEKLTRWLGVPSHPTNPIHPKPGTSISGLYNKIASGERPEGITVIRNSSSWIKLGPYATVLLGVAILYGYLRLPVDAWGRISPLAPLVLVLTLVVVPSAWGWLTWQNIKPRRGIALLLTPAEMVMRAKQQLLRVRWSNLLRVDIDLKSVWSVLEGVNENKTLVILRRNEPEIRYREIFLDEPLEVVLVLIEAYRKGLLP